MIVYNVTLSVDHEVHEAWLDWMKRTHIPDVMATGLFLDSRMFKVLSDGDSGVTYAVQYTCADMATYERYREQEAPRLQEHMRERYGDRVAAFRTLLELEFTV
ncbi:MAG: DUF4286 family protein [Flavobacteriales bacterium]